MTLGMFQLINKANKNQKNTETRIEQKILKQKIHKFDLMRNSLSSCVMDFFASPDVSSITSAKCIEETRITTIFFFAAYVILSPQADCYIFHNVFLH